MVNSIETDLINDKKGIENHHLCPLAWTRHEIYHLIFIGPTKDRKGLLPPKRTEKNFWAPKRT